jgi:tetratricopeptide (TPR) repeat protein
MSNKQAQNLKDARSAIDKQDYEKALEYVEDVLYYDADNYNALIFKGLCLFNLANKLFQRVLQTSSGPAPKLDDGKDKQGHSFQNAINAYATASKLNAKLPLAWQGMAEVYSTLLAAKVDDVLPTQPGVVPKTILDLIDAAPAKLIELYTTLIALVGYGQTSLILVL